jgi:hypothetical protein
LKRLALLFIGTLLITFYTVACSSNHATNIKTTLVNPGTGGNPEVKIIYCLGLKHKAKEVCLDTLYPDNINILIHPSNGQALKLAGRGSSVEKATVKFKDDDIYLIYLDTLNIKLPLTSNVKSTKFRQKGNKLVVEIEVKNIQTTITLKDNEGKIVLDYRIIK